MLSNSFFIIALTFMVLHEMDAVRCKEWRIFPGLSRLKDETGFIVFMLAHIPLFVTLFYYLFALPDPSTLIFSLNIFFIVHLGLHLFYLKHEKNLFKDWLSWVIISGAAVFGAMDLLINE